MIEPPLEKLCNVCEISLALSCFSKDSRRKDGRQGTCRACSKARYAAWRTTPRAKSLKAVRDKAYYSSNSDRLKARQSDYRKTNPHSKRLWDKKQKEHILAYRKSYAETARARHTQRYLSDIPYKIKCILRARFGVALRRLKAGKQVSPIRDLGCSPEELSQYIESQFKPGMTWANHGVVWHIDHIIPFSRFNLSDEEEQKRAVHYSNLQPLFAEENLSKNDKLPDEWNQTKELYAKAC